MSSAQLYALIADIRDALHGPLPGLPAQMRMAPVPRPGTERILDPAPDCRHAGVLVLLYPNNGGLCLVLTLRTDLLDHHRGQISFPGGSTEPGETVVEAALRETHEELAVDPAGLEVLGQLTPLYIPPSRFCIYPSVAFAPERPGFVPEQGEVAEVIEVPLAHLLDPETVREETWTIRDLPVRVPFYQIGPHKVWGATAMVLAELTRLLAA